MKRWTRRPAEGWIAFSLLITLTPGCSLFYSNPQVRILEVGIRSLGLSSGSASVLVEVRNPNRFGVELRELRYRLELGRGEGEAEWAPLASGFVDERVRIPSRGVEVISMTLPFEYHSLGPVARIALARGEIRYRIVGDLTARGPIGQLELPFETRGPLNLE